MPKRSEAEEAKTGTREKERSRFDPTDRKLHEALVRSFVKGVAPDAALFHFTSGFPTTDEEERSFLWTARTYAEHPGSPIRRRADKYDSWLRRALEAASAEGLMEARETRGEPFDRWLLWLHARSVASGRKLELIRRLPPERYEILSEHRSPHAAFKALTMAEKQLGGYHWIRDYDTGEDITHEVTAWVKRSGATEGEGRRYLLIDDETPDGRPVDLYEFLRLNEDGLGEGEAATIVALKPGETYRGGGGAVPEWSIRRVADAPSAIKPSVSAAEAPLSPPAATALPWVRVTRDPKRYEERLAQARAIGALSTPRKVYDLLAPVYAEEDQEVLFAVLMDVRMQLRGVAEVHRGSRSRTEVNVADVLRVAIVEGAEALIVCHNHPSGRADPSAADEELTKAIRKAADALRPGINFLDHVIVGTGEFYSFEEGKVTRVKSPGEKVKR